MDKMFCYFEQLEKILLMAKKETESLNGKDITKIVEIKELIRMIRKRTDSIEEVIDDIWVNTHI